MNIHKNNFLKRITLMLLLSVCFGILYFWLCFNTNIISSYRIIFPKQPAILWDVLPMLIVSIILGLIIGQNKKQKIIFILSGFASSVAINLLLIFIGMYQALSDFN